jgi:hypothetical protein
LTFWTYPTTAKSSEFVSIFVEKCLNDAAQKVVPLQPPPFCPRLPCGEFLGSCPQPVTVHIKLQHLHTDSPGTPSYRQACKKRRRLIPVDGFYEWKKVPGGKIPYSISMKDDSPFVFAGLWEGWKDPANDQWFHTSTIITGEPNELCGRSMPKDDGKLEYAFEND